VPLRVAWYRFRVTFARRWSGYLGLVLLVALLGGVAMASVAGARRTQSSYPAFLASTNPSDLVVSSFGAATTTASSATSTVTTQTMRALPLVRAVHSVDAFSLVPVSASGVPDLALSSEVQVAGSVDGFGFLQDRVAVVSGRLPALGNANEFVTTALGARTLGVRRGQPVTFAGYSPDQLQDPRLLHGGVTPAFEVTARLVGIVVLGNQVVEDDVDRYPTFAIFPPALAAKIGPLANATLYGLRLAHGAADVSRVEQEFEQAVPAGSTYEFHETASIEARVERAVRPESIALGVFGAIAAVAGLAITALAVSRLVQGAEAEVAILRALGADPWTAGLDQALGVGACAVLGAGAAAGVAIALSPLAPLGPVRPVYPHRGVAVDWTVIGIGVAVMAVVLVACATLAAWRSYRHAVREGRATPRGRSSAAARVGSASAVPVSVAVGVRFALEPGAGRAAVPVRSALLGAVLAVVTVVATLTFGNSLHTLVSRPALYGWNWDYLLNASNNVPPSTLAALDHDQDVAAWAGFGEVELQVDGVNVPTLMTPTPESLSPPILSGHGLESGNQIVLGPATLAQLHKHVGDTVVVAYGVPKDAPVYIPPTPLTVVGSATMPAIGFSSLIADHTSMGTGALVPNGVQPPAFVRAVTNPDQLFNGPALVVVKLRAGVAAGAGYADMTRLAAAANAAFASDPMAAGADITVDPVLRPAEIVNYRSTGDTPIVLAGALAAGALIALTLTLAASVRRRRREFAVLKVLGCTPRQIVEIVTVQALVPVAIGVVAGIPLGLAVGRQLWDAFARVIYAVPEPTTPVGALAVVAAAALTFACVVAMLPGVRAARIRIASVLRAE
jgi:hypothetical protein